MKIEVEHPYIAVEPGVCGGSPVIKGTRIPVWAIVGYHKNLNYTIEQILEELPTLTPAQVYDALSFYYDHQEEIERELESNNDEAYWKRVVLGDKVCPPHGIIYSTGHVYTFRRVHVKGGE